MWVLLPGECCGAKVSQDSMVDDGVVDDGMVEDETGSAEAHSSAASINGRQRPATI